MLEFNENTENAKILAVHYASILKDEQLVKFFGGEIELKNQDEAKQAIRGFWKITDLAIEDNNNDVSVQGVCDIEFWMHKLFNKVYGYMIKNGYGDLWEESMAER